jgi:hypothetical protein
VWKPEVRHEMPELTTQCGCENWRNLILSPASYAIIKRVSSQNYYWIQLFITYNKHCFYFKIITSKLKWQLVIFFIINVSVWVSLYAFWLILWILKLTTM